MKKLLAAAILDGTLYGMASATAQVYPSRPIDGSGWQVSGIDASFYAVTVPRYASRTAGSLRSSAAGPWRVMRPRSSTKP